MVPRVASHTARLPGAQPIAMHGTSVTLHSRPEPFDWSALVPHLIHPTKVFVIEAMLWIDRPLSASELEKVLDGAVVVSNISYHVRSLARAGVLQLVEKQRIRGTWRRRYALNSP